MHEGAGPKSQGDLGGRLYVDPRVETIRAARSQRKNYLNSFAASLAW
jgi:hypothetical protein